MTLIEALVVLGLTVLVSALAFPNLERSARIVAYEEARARLMADAAEARGRAITRGEEAGLEPGPDGASYATADRRLVRLPARLRLVAPEGLPRFAPDGSTDGGTLLLRGDGWQGGIVLDPVNGLVQAVGR